ncbi:MAG: lipocalin family protein [Bacteroidales bacterium]|nr:lipocalin family protein [Bacteroidales bacterium]
MKKGFLFALFAAIAMCFVACTPDDPSPDNGNSNNYSNMVVGTWLVDNMTFNGEEMTPEDMRITMNEGGTGEVVVNGVHENNTFSWTVSGSTLSINPNGGGNYTFNISSITATECSMTGNVVPGTDMTGDVAIHMTKTNGDNPGPGPTPEDFPANTMWEFAFDTTIVHDSIPIPINANMTFSLDFVNTTNCDLSIHYMISAMSIPMADSVMTIPATYTYNTAAAEGELTLISSDGGDNETLPFIYNSSDNTIIIDVPEEFFDNDDDEGGSGTPSMPTHWVFLRVR